jgi:glutamate-1-semialdehyde 2,1-aminomutase
VQRQFKKGVTFSLSHPIETTLAERIIKTIPCAEMVRYGKNGSDVTAGAIRVARAYTGRDHVAVCGYHGWQDWYIGSTTRNAGVPDAVKKLTHRFAYNDLDSLAALFKQYPGQIAAVIMEPMNTTFPKAGFLQAVKELTHRHKALLVFDEMITGFRFSEGGAQELFSVTPDLATFGKGVANGYPVSLLVGKAKFMKLLEDIFFSFTFGGETLSLAAAEATLEKLERKPVIQTLRSQGEKLMGVVRSLISQHELEDVLSIDGHPSWSFLIFKDRKPYSMWDFKTFFLQECFKRGLLTIGTHNMSYAHSDRDLHHLERAYDEIFGLLSESIKREDLKKRLNCKVIVPLFKVR